jgi:hypothetical protein
MQALLLIELFDDGGIRVAPPTGRPGIATRAEMTRWVDVAAVERWPVRVTGHVTSSLARQLIDRLPSGLAELTITESSPEGWNRNWTTLMWAADRGLVEEVVDLLDRGAPRTASRRALTPYRLAMRRGHVPVMAALRAAGAESPVLARPPGAPDAFVMRQYVGAFFWYLAPIGPIVGLAAAIVLRSPMSAIVGIVVGVAIAVLGAFAEFAAGWTVLGVDGPNVHYRRLMRWRGPVDLRQLVALGYRGSVHRRSPTLVRLANRQDGEPFGRRTHAGFDQATIELLRTLVGVRVLTLYVGWNFLRPGIERYIAEHVDPATTLISTNAQPLFGAPEHP